MRELIEQGQAGLRAVDGLVVMTIVDAAIVELTDAPDAPDRPALVMSPDYAEKVGEQLMKYARAARGEVEKTCS